MSNPAQHLEIFQSTWAMEIRQPGKRELSLEEKCELAAGAGFEGLNIDLDVEDMPPVKEIKKTLASSGLACSIVAFPATVDELRFSLERCNTLSATSLVVNARYFPYSIQKGVDFIGQCVEEGQQFGMPVHFETHRLTLTNDLLYTVQLLEHCPDLELVADLSHYVLGREMPMPVDTFHDDLIKQILRRSVSIQGRIASREQIQVPLDFPQHVDWMDQFIRWWKWGIHYWRDSTPQDGRFNFTCELGPPPYAMTDKNEMEFSDRWQEGLVLKKQIETIWSEYG